MDRPEIEAVIGHELTHVANGDMVTLTLLQGVLNTFVFFFSRVIGGLIDSALRGRDDDRRGGGIGYFVATARASRARIFGHADRRSLQPLARVPRGIAAALSSAGRAKMIAALRRLGAEEESALPKSLAAFGINGGGVSALFRSHPPIAQRIEALQATAEQGSPLSASA